MGLSDDEAEDVLGGFSDVSGSEVTSFDQVAVGVVEPADEEGVGESFGGCVESVHV